MTDLVHRPRDLVGDRYQVLEFIDQGGMQQVYRALDMTFGKQVALKTPKNPSAEKRFARSAQLCAKITHPNIAKTLDYFESDGSFYLVEELIDAENLGTRLARDYDYLDPHLVAHILHHLARGVAASHHVQVFHRDLKPSNIMVSADANLTEVKITDFGIAKMAEAEFDEALREGEASITTSQTVVGALPYMAPELIEHPTEANLQADVWSLGAIVYLLVSGQHPFGSGLQAVPRILDAKVPDKPKLFAQKRKFRPLTDEMWEIISVCLSRDPAGRPTADELVERCDRLCYSLALRGVGKVSSFRIKTGHWGFIATDEMGDVFFHADSFYGRRPKVDQRVSYAAFPGSPSPRAFPVLPLKLEDV